VRMPEPIYTEPGVAQDQDLRDKVKQLDDLAKAATMAALQRPDDKDMQAELKQQIDNLQKQIEKLSKKTVAKKKKKMTYKKVQKPITPALPDPNVIDVDAFEIPTMDIPSQDDLIGAVPNDDTAQNDRPRELQKAAEGVEKPTGIGQMAKNIGQGQSIQNDPRYRKQVYQNQQDQTRRQRTIARGKAGYGEEPDDFSDIPDMTEGAMNKLDIERQDLEHMSGLQFEKAYGMTKQEWRNRHPGGLPRVQPKANILSLPDDDIDTAKVKPSFDRTGRMVRQKPANTQQGMRRMLGRPKATRPAAELNPVEVTMQVPNRKTDRYDLLPARIFNSEAEAREFARRVNGHITSIKPVVHENSTQNQRLHAGDPVIVTAPNEFEGATGEIYELSPSGAFVIVDLYNHGKHSMHLSDVAYNDYADQEEADDWYDDADEFGKPGSEFFSESANPKLDAIIKNIQARVSNKAVNDPATMKRVAQMVQQADPAVPDAMATAQQLVQQYGQSPAPIQTDTSGLRKLKPGETHQGINAYNQALGQAPIYKANEGYQDFNKVEPYAVCLAGKPVKKFDYYEQARQFHDNWKKKLYNTGKPEDKVKADKITLMPVMDEGIKSRLAGAALAGAAALGGGAAHAKAPDAGALQQTLKQQISMKAPQVKPQVPIAQTSQPAFVNTDVDVLKQVAQGTMQHPNIRQVDAVKALQWLKANPGYQDVAPRHPKAGQYDDNSSTLHVYKPEQYRDVPEAANPAQQAAIAVAMKKAGKKPKQMDEDTGSWIVYDPETKQIKKRFKTHTAGKSYAQTHGLGFASSEYYFDRVKGQQSVTETVTDVKAEMARVYRKLAPKIERHRDSFLAGQLYDELENIAELHGAETEFKRMMAGARNRAHMDYDTNPGGFQNWFWYLPFENDELREDAIPAKMVMQGFVVEYNPSTKTVVISKRGQELEKYRYNGQASLLSFQRNVGHRIKALEDDLYGADDEAGAVSLSRVKVPGRGHGYQELGEDDSSTSSDEAESAILKRIMVAHLDLLKEFGPQKVMQAVEEVAYNIGDLDEIGSSDVSAWVHEVKQILGAEWEPQISKYVITAN